MFFSHFCNFFSALFFPSIEHKTHYICSSYFYFYLLYYLDSRPNLQTPQLSLDEPKQPSHKSRRLDSTNTVDSATTADSQSIQRTVSEIDSENKPAYLTNQKSVANSEDDINGKFEKAKSVSLTFARIRKFNNNDPHWI